MGGWGLALAAGGFWLGILVASGVQAGEAASLACLAGGAAAVAVPSLLAPARPGRRLAVGLLAVGSGFFLLGLGWGRLRAERVRASPLAALTGRGVRVMGSLGSEPRPGPLGWTATLRTEVAEPLARARPGPGPVFVRDLLWLQGRGRPPGAGLGDRVVVEGAMRLPRGGFGAHLRRLGYAGAVSVRRLSRRGPPASLPARAAAWLRAALRRSLLRVVPAREAGLLLGLTIGDTSRLDPEIEEDFRATGLSHLTAVSGENLAMFLAPILGFAGVAGLGRRARFGLGLAAVAFFVLLTGGEPSVLRAAAMAGLTLLGVFLGRPRSPPAIVGGAVLLLLGVDPALVHSIGFQLSVGATVGMALLARPLAERLVALPMGLALAAGTTLAAQAGVLPLLLYHFGAVPTVTVAANLLAFPAVAPAMLLGLVAGAVGVASRPVGVLLGWGTRLPLGYLESLADRLARSSLPSITSPGGQATVLVGGLVGVAAAAWWARARWRPPKVARALVVALLPLLVWSRALRAGPPAQLTAVFFDVGQGDAALVRSPGGAAILIDGGPDPETVAVKLAGLGVRRLDLVVATHPHADHVEGLPAVLARFPVGLVIDPGCGGDSPSYGALLRSVRSAGVSFRHPRPGTVFRVGDVRVEVLGPEACYRGTASDPNNDSLVLRLTRGAASILLPGDVEQPAQLDLLQERPGLLPATVLKVPHHGGDTSLDRFFLAVRARVAVVSVGPNRYGHPSPRVLSELAEDGMRVFRTDRRGDLTVEVRGSGVAVSG